MPFEALELSLVLVKLLNPIVALIAKRDVKLADQIKQARASVPMCLSEGRRRKGGDRLHLWRVASGSTEEVQTALRVAEASEYVSAGMIAEPLDVCDRLLAMTYRMTT